MKYVINVAQEHESPTGLVEPVGRFHEIMGGLAAERGVPRFELSIVLTNDLTASVAERGQSGFTAERLGGSVKGKTIADIADFSRVTIVLDTAQVDDADTFSLLRMIHVLGHEYGHALIGRLRATSEFPGAELVDPPSPAEAATWIAETTADEYRCDLFADSLFDGMTYRIDGSEEHRPLNYIALFGDDIVGEFAACLDDVVYPGWPNMVMEYRVRRLSLDEMYANLLQQTWSVLVLTAHADASTGSAKAEPLLARFNNHPAVARYLHGVWAPMRQVLDSHADIPEVGKFQELDCLVRQHSKCIVELWRQLGVTGRRIGSDRIHLDVSDPLAT